MKNVAVILCGSGFKDGSEIREAVACLWALSKAGAQVAIFAPDAPQTDVVNCQTLRPMPQESRNMLTEAARIARGDIKSLDEMPVADFDALVIPGGFGVAKNLCNFASKGSHGEARADVKEIIENFHGARKPIAAICIAPALVAIALPDANLELTLGAHGEAAQEIEKLGHRHVVTNVTECHVDLRNKIISTPAYMYPDAPLHQIFTGIERAISATLEL